VPLKILSWAAFFLSVFCFLFAGYLLAQRYGLTLYFENYQPPVSVSSPKTALSNIPVRLRLPSVSIDLLVVPAYKTDSRWPTTTKGVSYLASSPLPGDPGNSIFYGHNWTRILGNLKNSQAGDPLIIGYSDGSSKTFTVTRVETVGPNAVEILDSTDFPQITLYTCTGFLDTRRLVVFAR
jgi:LPXTG-site transpeptidase (sortase) family protein